MPILRIASSMLPWPRCSLMGMVSFWVNPAYEKGVLCGHGGAGCRTLRGARVKYGITQSNGTPPKPPGA